VSINGTEVNSLVCDNVVYKQKIFFSLLGKISLTRKKNMNSNKVKKSVTHRKLRHRIDIVGDTVIFKNDLGGFNKVKLPRLVY